MTRRTVTIRGPLGLLLGLFFILLWLVAVFFPTIVILSIAAYTDSLGRWEPWVTTVLLQGIWWYMSGAYD